MDVPETISEMMKSLINAGIVPEVHCLLYFS